MNMLYLLLLFPLIWPFIAKHIWDNEINYQEMGLQILIVAVLVSGTWQAGKWSATSDTEVWNGQITSKERTHGTYEESYDCNCTTDSKGNTSCSTCYTTHYTVSWTANTTVGNVVFDYKDSLWSSVYDSPDPAVYKNCKIGEPAAIEHRYTNYVQAVPTSLFNDNSTATQQFAGKIPSYPRVYGFYKYNRVINVGSSVPAALQQSINNTLNDSLKTLGYQKQANIVVILTDIQDPSYKYAIERAWLGGEKNDVIVIVGLDGNTVTWADVITWALNSGNELFHVTLRDSLMQLGSITNTDIASTITDTISTTYDRPHMKDYEYLADEVTPPTWVIYLAIFFALCGPIALTIVFRIYDVDFFKK